MIGQIDRPALRSNDAAVAAGTADGRLVYDAVANG
jgi:hypothetical protein